MSYISQSLADYNNRFKDLKDYILYSLGWPVVRVELVPEHLNLAIMDAVTLYYDKAANDVDCVIVSAINDGIVDIPEGIKPQMIENVIFQQNLIDGFAKGMYISGTEDALGKYVLPFQSWQTILDNFDMVGYYSYLMRLEDFKKALGIDRTWDIMNGKIYLYPRDVQHDRVGIVYKSTFSDEILETEWWIKEYSLARAKFLLGMIRRKMSGFQTAGGNIANDGADLVNEAKEEMTVLKEKLDKLQKPLPILQF
jgi:hypothetical protein